MGLKLLFFGTPETAVPFLEACARGHEVLAAVTRPDKPSGRELRIAPPPVKAAAQRLGIPVLQPENPSAAAEDLRNLGADLAVVVAYGKLLKPDLLAAARLGFMNVHFSILPKCRGAAPIPWTLMRGETRTGVSLFWIDEGLDTGPVQAQRELVVGPDEDAPGLTRALVRLGVEALQETLEDLAQGRVRREPQSGEPSLAPKLTREDARVGFDRPASELHDRVRALAAGPRAFIPDPRAGAGARSVALLKTALDREAEGASSPPPPGTIVRVEKGKGVLVQCRTGRVWLLEVQPDGKRPIPAADFINGLRLKAGDRLYPDA